MRRALSVALTVAALLLIVTVGPSAAQFATIAFPDTTVGSSATVKCPNNVVSICFGTDCTGSGTVQSVSGPNAPFSIGRTS